MERITITDCISCPFCDYDTEDSSYKCNLIPHKNNGGEHIIKVSTIEMSKIDPLCPLKETEHTFSLAESKNDR